MKTSRRPASFLQENGDTTRSYYQKLTSRDVDYVATAIGWSRYSTHSRIKIGCVITDSRGEFISSGFNKAKSHPLQAKYNNRVSRLAPQQFIHAEIDAVSSIPRGTNGTNLVAYVGRLDCSGKQAMCKPCPACTAALLDSGVSTVCYTNREGKIVKHGL